ncbi:hypothetical protein D9601_17540 [Sphingomonas sp. MA1305]|uniref:hypothetical protein n=1 Tax=Sphingomonas sp. MA1305 TaxID=2479204 RepID=UPI0018DF3CCF|nr:hypothetical protein [Sphingomonas sp. MA1305]MBI0477154.1 hypothetical protein [Sphingomonas sp. MA1305]
MFVDFRDQPPPPPWQPRHPPRRPPLTRRQRRIVYAIVWFNIAMLVAAPIGGATLLGLLIPSWR